MSPNSEALTQIQTILQADPVLLQTCSLHSLFY